MIAQSTRTRRIEHVGNVLHVGHVSNVPGIVELALKWLMHFQSGIQPTP